jgi:hypothetical protein
MGGLFSPTQVQAPIQSNEAEMLMAKAQMQQNELLAAQNAAYLEEQTQADEAAADRLREIEIRDAEAQKEADERKARMEKGKRDLLFRTALGTKDDTEEDNMLLLGGG